MRDGRGFCLNGNTRKISIFKYDNGQDKIVAETNIPLRNYISYQMNTLQVTNKYIYVAIGERNRIDKYNHDGVYVCSVGSEVGKFKNPRLCGSDRDGNILIADRDNNRFQVMTPTGEFHVWHIPGLQKPIYAAFIGDKLWVADECKQIQCFELE